MLRFQLKNPLIFGGWCCLSANPLFYQQLQYFFDSKTNMDFLNWICSTKKSSLTNIMWNLCLKYQHPIIQSSHFASDIGRKAGRNAVLRGERIISHEFANLHAAGAMDVPRGPTTRLQHLEFVLCGTWDRDRLWIMNIYELWLLKVYIPKKLHIILRNNWMDLERDGLMTVIGNRKIRCIPVSCFLPAVSWRFWGWAKQGSSGRWNKPRCGPSSRIRGTPKRCNSGNMISNRRRRTSPSASLLIPTLPVHDPHS